jgi:hypothetical protein
MRHSFIIILLGLTIIQSCRKDKPKPIDKLLIGEWVLDSISGTFNKWDTDIIFITDNGLFWKFTYWSDRYLVDSAFQINGEKIMRQGSIVYNIEHLDTNNLIITDNSNNKFLYKNRDRFNQQNLQDFISRDSLHQKINGWWKLQDATYRPVGLVNYPDAVNDFTLFLNKNGDGKIYIDNIIDSFVNYSWTANPMSLSLGRGCIAGSDLQIIYLNEKKMIIKQDILIRCLPSFDTLTFERCAPLTEN